MFSQSLIRFDSGVLAGLISLGRVWIGTGLLAGLPYMRDELGFDAVETCRNYRRPEADDIPTEAIQYHGADMQSLLRGQCDFNFLHCRRLLRDGRLGLCGVVRELERQLQLERISIVIAYEAARSHLE
jgi:hypothetical protein